MHRLSGLALACFLPLHFLALGLAIDGEARRIDRVNLVYNAVPNFRGRAIVNVCGDFAKGSRS